MLGKEADDMSDEFVKIVDFQWCNKCRHFDNDESEDPCDECLNTPVLDHSHRPLYFDEK